MSTRFIAGLWHGQCTYGQRHSYDRTAPFSILERASSTGIQLTFSETDLSLILAFQCLKHHTCGPSFVPLRQISHQQCVCAIALSNLQSLKPVGRLHTQATRAAAITLGGLKVQHRTRIRIGNTLYAFVLLLAQRGPSESDDLSVWIL